MSGSNGVRNVLVNWGAFLVSAVAGLYLSPKTVGYLGPADYGLWVLLSSLVAPLALLDFGTRSAVTKLVSKLHAREAHEDAQRIVSGAAFVYVTSALLSATLSLVIAWSLPRFYTLEPAALYHARIVVVILGFTTALGLITALYGGLLAGVRRLDVVGAQNLFLETARVPAVVFVLSSGFGIVGLSLVGIALATARLFYHRQSSSRCYPEVSVRPKVPTRADLKAILDISVFSTIIYTLGSVLASGTVYIVGRLLPFEAVGAFAIGGTLPQYVNALTLPVAQHVLSEASRLSSLGDDAAVEQLLSGSMRIGGLVLFAPVVGFLARGETFLQLWMGQPYSTESAPVLYVLSVLCICTLLRHVLQTAFIAVGEHRKLIGWYLLEACTVLPLVYVLASKWGIKGAALAQAIPAAAIALLVFPRLAARHLKVAPFRLIAEGILRPILCLVPFGVVLYWQDGRFAADSYLAFFGQILAALPIALTIAVRFGLTQPERTKLSASIQTRLRTLIPR